MNDKNDPILNRIVVINENIDFVVKDEIVSIVTKNDSKIQDVFRKLGKKIPQESYLELDDMSSFIFMQIDGKRNIYEIGQELKKAKKEECEPLYERLLMFLEYLEKTKNYITIKEA